MANVVFDNVWKIYPDGTEAVKELDLEIEDGEFVILVGPSGCGKSTALRMVAGLEDISRGELRIGEKVVNDLTPKERDIAMVFQSYALYPHMSVRDNMGFALKLAKIDKDEINRRVEEAAEILDLTEFLDRKPKALSGGQRQRVAMGRAIVRNPQAFLMDEPLSNLDAKLRVQMRSEIAQLQQNLGVTTIYVTHDQVEAMTMGDRVAVLKKGVLQQAEAPQRLYDKPDNLFVAGFIGSPSMNLMEADLESNPGGNPILRVGEQTLEVPEEAMAEYPRVRDKVGGKVAAGIRPEHSFIPDASTPEGGTLRGDVRLVEALGSEVLVHVATQASPVVTEDMREAVDDEEAFARMEESGATGGMDMTFRFDPSFTPKVGDTLEVGVQRHRMHFFDLDDGQALR